MNRESQLASGGGLLFLLGALAFFPPMFDRQLLILAWLGSMSQPIGLSAMIVGGLLWGMGRLKQFRDAPPPGIHAGDDEPPSLGPAPAAAVAPPDADPADSR